jgi:hypothetical protein
MSTSGSKPMAKVHIRWRTPGEEGRRGGPPPGPQYAATAVFVAGDDAEVQPDWPASGQHLSVKLQYVSPLQGYEVNAVAEFLAPDLVRDQLRRGAIFLIMEGPRAVGEATVVALLDAKEGS